MKKQSFRELLNNPVFYLMIITIVGGLARLCFLGTLPVGLHQDEAYSAYNSWAVLNYGKDSFGHVRPVYYTAWGSGMSVLYSLFTMPFFKLFGVSLLTIRLPQAILGTVCIPVMYAFGKEIFDSDKRALSLAALLAINPWHILQSRVGIDCCTAVPMLLLFLYFLVRFLNGKRKSIWAAAVFLILSLYSYALLWYLIPLMLVFILIFYFKRISFEPRFWCALLIVFLFAAPLLLFIGVNQGLIDEINTPLFSIPRLPSIRTDEFSLAPWQLKQRFIALMYLLFYQHDSRWWISDSVVGSFYYISLPFVIIGLIGHFIGFIKTIVKKEKIDLSYIIAIWMGASVIVGSTIDQVLYHKIDYMICPIVIYTAMGLWNVYDIFRQKKKTVYIMSVAYTSFFVYFIWSRLSYPRDYSLYGDSWDSRMNYTGYEKALDEARNMTDGKIYVHSLSYANLLLDSKVSPDDFLATVIFVGDDPQFMFVSAFDRYVLDAYPEENEDAVIVYCYLEEDLLKEMGYSFEHSDICYGVAFKPSHHNR